MQRLSVRLTYERIVEVLSGILISSGIPEGRAATAATLFADASRDGTPSHGLNRFAGFIRAIDQGFVRAEAEPSLEGAYGAVERWNGNLGPGMLNARFAMGRAIELAGSGTIGAVGLRNTNHWMRGANYGWQAAEAGCIGICWTNTEPNVPPWGGTKSGVGNNPLIIAVPRSDGHVVLDMAMSQFSYGRLSLHARRGEPLPVPGGFDRSGRLTTDAHAIFDGGRVLPAGYWKGSGLALMLDLVAALLSGGRTTREIGTLEREHSVSQAFIAIDLRRLGDADRQRELVDGAVEFLQGSGGAGDGAGPRYPGQASLERRQESGANGVEVDEEVWRTIEQLAATRRTSSASRLKQGQGS